MLEKFKLVEDGAFRTGKTVFTCLAGKEVSIRATDSVNNKVLVDFGNGNEDWFHTSIMDDLVAVTHNAPHPASFVDEVDDLLELVKANGDIRDLDQYPPENMQTVSGKILSELMHRLERAESALKLIAKDVNDWQKITKQGDE